jgi:hypothetical protein
MLAQEWAFDRANGPVIVRAYGDEPVQMYVKSFDSQTAELHQAGSSVTIHLPMVYVYQFDEATFANLTEAWSRKDPDVLAAAWRSAHHATLNTEVRDDAGA